jgi:pyrimidine-specific ribonucleoside hydrolase
MILLDTETGDPDDILVIAYLADKGLSGVTMNPGTDEQVGLVRSVLRELGLDIPVGANRVVKENSCVSDFYPKIYSYKPETPDYTSKDLISKQLEEGAKILTCGLPKNIDGISLKEWWAQGGFAGDSVMGSRVILDKFKGLETCQSFNFSNRRLIERCIANSKQRHFISKNICHGAIFDKTKSAKNPVIRRIMDIYLQKHDGKAFHDLLAAWAMINPEHVQWEEVEIYYEQNKVGSRLCKATNTFISVDYDADKFWDSI